MQIKHTVRVMVAVLVMLPVAAAGLAADERDESYPYWSYDIGAGSGYSSEGAFVEGQLGLNTHFNPWLTWRNSGFYRNQPDSDDFFGLDTSLLAGHRTRLTDQIRLSYEAGGGYRFTSIQQHAPFAEAGLTGRAGDLQLRASAKYLFYELVGDDRDNEFVFSVSISGRTTGRF